METGLRFRDVELSSVDTTILLMGVLFAGQYYDRADRGGARDPASLRTRSTSAPTGISSAPTAAPRSRWAGIPEGGLIPANWVGFNEGMFVNILALGSPTHPGPANLWEQWTARYPNFWRGEGPTRRLAFAPLFGHQYSHIWIDFRGIRDAPMRDAGFDYFENSRRATYANRAYCIANPMGWDGYSKRRLGAHRLRRPGRFRAALQGRRRGPSSAMPRAGR